MDFLDFYWTTEIKIVADDDEADSEPNRKIDMNINPIFSNRAMPTMLIQNLIAHLMV
jgi:hypothetical protein